MNVFDNAFLGVELKIKPKKSQNIVIIWGVDYNKFPICDIAE